MVTTHTFAVLEISPAAYAEIKSKLEDAGYNQAFTETADQREAINMAGLGLTTHSVVCPDCSGRLQQVGEITFKSLVPHLSAARVKRSRKHS